MQSSKINAFAGCEKNLTLAYHSNMYKLEWLKLDIMIDTVKLYKLILVFLTLIVI